MGNIINIKDHMDCFQMSMKLICELNFALYKLIVFP